MGLIDAEWAGLTRRRRVSKCSSTMTINDDVIVGVDDENAVSDDVKRSQQRRLATWRRGAAGEHRPAYPMWNTSSPAQTVPRTHLVTSGSDVVV